MPKKIKVVVWETEDAVPAGAVYRLDEKGAGDRLFRDLLRNAETDGREHLKLELWTEKQWKKAERIGKEMA